MFARRAGYVVIAAGMALGLNAGTALANTNPGPVNTSYYFNTNLYGATHFTVYNGSSSGNGSVTLQMWGSSGPTEYVKIDVEIQTCGFFGCNWDGKTVGGDCYRYLYNGGYAECDWSVPISNTLHRIDFHKATDGYYIAGSATIK
jgi:hypothetical protein